MQRFLVRIPIYLLLVSIAVTAAYAGKLPIQSPIRLSDGQPLKAVYYFPHWWEPWKSDDGIVSADLNTMKGLGFNTICVDHEVSQAVDREWYWLDREYKLADQQNMRVLPWLQLQSADRKALMKFAHLTVQAAINQDKKVEDDYINFRDPEFRRSMALYVIAYLERYGQSPALLRVKEGKNTHRVVGLMLEAGWRNADGLPLSFDEDNNAYFRKWMKSSYYNLNQLNKKWGTKYKSFDQIDPCDKNIFNYEFKDKSNMPFSVQEHTSFRARMIDEAMDDIAKQVRKRFKDVLFVAEVAYPFNSTSANAGVYRWNDANELKSAGFADILFVRTLGNTLIGQPNNDVMVYGDKLVVPAYRLLDGASDKKAISLALDCAVTGNGMAYYNWNENADSSSALYNAPDRQVLAKIMTTTYDVLCDPDKRHNVPAEAPRPKVTAAPPVVQPANLPAVQTTIPAASAPSVIQPAPVIIPPTSPNPGPAADLQPTTIPSPATVTAPSEITPASPAH